MQELSKNRDFHNPYSSFLYERDGILYMGPVWDMDQGYGNAAEELYTSTDGLVQQVLWFERMAQAVSYTHLDVYKRQLYDYATAQRQGVGDLYVDLLLNADQLYGDGNGYLNKAEIMAYLDAAQLELDVKRLLFGMVSSAKNPY